MSRLSGCVDSRALVSTQRLSANHWLWSICQTASSNANYSASKRNKRSTAGSKPS